MVLVVDYFFITGTGILSTVFRFFKSAKADDRGEGIFIYGILTLFEDTFLIDICSICLIGDLDAVGDIALLDVGLLTVVLNLCYSNLTIGFLMVVTGF